MNALVGIDIGGTNTKIGIIQFGDQFKVLKQGSIPTQVEDPSAVYMQRIAAATRDLIDAAGRPNMVGVGVGCPGLINPWQGIVGRSPNMGNMENFALRDNLAKAIGLPVEIQNDGNSSVLGEWLFSPASKGVNNIIIFTLGTGVGGGVVCDGHLLVGADNAATELGHLKVEWNNGAPCGCGKKGCVESYAGAAGIARIALQQIVASGGKTSLKPEGINTKDISIAAGKGDRVALEVLKKVGEYLGRAFCLVVETFNPEKIIIGGGASAAMEFLRPGINATIDEFGSFPMTLQRVKIERSAFPDDINIIGAAAVYLNAHPQK
jgi:glucokinase